MTDRNENKEAWRKYRKGIDAWCDVSTPEELTRLTLEHLKGFMEISKFWTVFFHPRIFNDVLAFSGDIGQRGGDGVLFRAHFPEEDGSFISRKSPYSYLCSGISRKSAVKAMHKWDLSFCIHGDGEAIDIWDSKGDPVRTFPYNPDLLPEVIAAAWNKPMCFLSYWPRGTMERFYISVRKVFPIPGIRELFTARSHETASQSHWRIAPARKA